MSQANVSFGDRASETGLLLDAVTREVIAIDGFQVASTTKWSSKKSQRHYVHCSGKYLPEVQRRHD